MKLDPTLVRECMERVLPLGYKPEDYATVDLGVPVQIARLVVKELRHEIRTGELKRSIPPKRRNSK